MKHYPITKAVSAAHCDPPLGTVQFSVRDGKGTGRKGEERERETGGEEATKRKRKRESRDRGFRGQLAAGRKGEREKRLAGDEEEEGK